MSFQCLQLAAKSGNARARYFGEPGVICIGDNFEQLRDTVASAMPALHAPHSELPEMEFMTQ